jgi:hypothetical protein
MHFLSHYYTEGSHQHPLYTAALILPDLTRGFTKIYNSVIVKTDKPETDSILQVHNGILAHFAGDKKFHSSVYFAEANAFAIQSFIGEGLSREKYRHSVLAHLVVEMLIDAQILHLHPEVGHNFYEALSNAGEKELMKYFEHFGLREHGNGFLAKLRGFQKSKFLFMLKENEKVLFGLEKIYESATGIGFETSDKGKFLKAINNIDENVRYCWENLLDLNSMNE